MLAQRATKAHARSSLLALLVAAVMLVLMAAESLAQSPGASQPSGRNSFFSAPQNANAPAVRIPVTPFPKRLTDRPMNSLPPAFSTGVYATGGARAGRVAVGDLNSDGWPDLAVPNYCPNWSFPDCLGGSVAVFIGSGGGAFSGPAVYESNASGTYAVSIADVNGDGSLDVLAASTCELGGYPPCLYSGQLLGNGDGSLQPAQYYLGVVGSASGNSATDDLNGDGNLDLVTVSDSGVYVQLGNADGTYQPAVLYDSGGDNALAVAVADVNGDGYSDILAVNECADLSTCMNVGATGSIGVLIGNGDGTFAATISFSTGGVGSSAITIADVNRDDKPDLLVTNLCNDQGVCPEGGSTVGVLINTAPYVGTATTIASSVNPSIVGKAVTFTATVKSSSGTLPEGAIITFKNGVTVLGTAPLSAGIASLTTAALPAGTFNITANYAFDGAYGASVARVSQVVKAVRGTATTLSLTASPNPGSVHQAITFTAAVTSVNGTIPDGEFVTLYNRATPIGAGITTGGVAQIVIPSLPRRTYTIWATYPGDATFKASSGTFTGAVVGAPSVTFGPYYGGDVYGQAATFIVDVYSADFLLLIPTGTVRLTSDRFTLATVPLGILMPGIAEATFTTSTLSAGTHTLQWVYSGDTEYASSTSPLMNLVVQQTTSSTTLTSSVNPSVQGQPVTFTAEITSPTVIPKGFATFTNGKTVLGTVQLSGGMATLTTSSLSAGTTVVTVTYEGNSNIGGSAASVAQVVQ